MRFENVAIGTVVIVSGGFYLKVLPNTGIRIDYNNPANLVTYFSKDEDSTPVPHVFSVKTDEWRHYTGIGDEAID